MKLCYMEHTQHRVTCEYTSLLASRCFLSLTIFQQRLQKAFFFYFQVYSVPNSKKDVGLKELALDKIISGKDLR